VYYPTGRKLFLLSEALSEHHHLDGGRIAIIIVVVVVMQTLFLHLVDMLLTPFSLGCSIGMFSKILRTTSGFWWPFSICAFRQDANITKIYLNLREVDGLQKYYKRNRR
jgi:hypothetical protein